MADASLEELASRLTESLPQSDAAANKSEQFLVGTHQIVGGSPASERKTTSGFSAIRFFRGNIVPCAPRELNLLDRCKRIASDIDTPMPTPRCARQ